MPQIRRVKVTRIEERPNDTWYDMNLRRLRTGEVRYYRVKDFLTGEWLFKLCRDEELGKVLVKAVKCPPGIPFVQLEGNTMVFQQSLSEGWLYDVVSVARADKSGRLSRRLADSLQDIPHFIRENYEIRSYEEATGKKAPGKNWVTLVRAGDEKAMILLFLFERAWTVSPATPEEKLKELERQGTLKPKQKEVDTGEVWRCPVCGDRLSLKHVEKEARVRHVLRRSR